MAKKEFKPLPKDANGDIDKDKIYQMFSESPHVEWAPFAKEQEWDVDYSRTKVPYLTWVDHKRAAYSRAAQEEIADQFFRRNYAWQRDIMRTLDSYPATIDMVMAMLQYKINKAFKSMQEDQAIEKAGGTVTEPRFDVLDTQLSKWAHTLTGLTDAKYKSLLLDKTIAKIKETAEIHEASRTVADNKQTRENEIVIEVMGGEKLTGRELANYITQYRGVPQAEKEVEDVTNIDGTVAD